MKSCQVETCDYAATYLVEPGVYLCDRHGSPGRGSLVCRFCNCAIESAENPHGDHASACPRARDYSPAATEEADRG